MKLMLGILCGGRSGEHEVSLRSASGIYQALDRERFEPLLVAIDKSGGWHVGKAEALLLDAHDPARIRIDPSAPEVVPLHTAAREGECVLVSPGDLSEQAAIEAFLPIIHGTDGEDGALQGMLQLWGLPYVGADVLGSAVGMDKDVMKRLLTQAGLPVAPFEAFHSLAEARAGFADLASRLGLPLFVKPAALGSSVGVSRVEDRGDYFRALADAFSYGEKVVVEQEIEGREVECSVLGSRYSETCPPKASRAGEIRPRHGFYSYAAKYLDHDGAELIVPADLPPGVEERIQQLSLRAFETLECDGMARVDFFFADDGRILVNELNTLPGFTPISMYPKLWEASGLSYTDLLTRLVELALERQQRRGALKRDYDMN